VLQHLKVHLVQHYILRPGGGEGGALDAVSRNLEFTMVLTYPFRRKLNSAEFMVSFCTLMSLRKFMPGP